MPGKEAMFTFFKRLLCRHTHRKLINIEFDGDAVYVCESCEKVFRVPL